MFRQFEFEGEVHHSLSCVPMGARRKLDRAGIKISLEQWQALGHGERLAICHLPAAAPDELDAMRMFIKEAVERRCGIAPKDLSADQRRVADPPDDLPAALIENARTLGVALDQAAWQRLDDDQRYALVKLGGGAKRGHDFAAALKEFLR